MTKEQFLRKWGWLVLQDEKEILSDLLTVIEHEIPKVKEPQPTKQAKPFDQDRFEEMFRAVVASGRTESYEQDFLATNICLEKLDAFYASKEKGGNNEY